MKNITIKEIAREAGVSIATVSNVLNDKPNKATQQTIDKIHAVVEKYNYSPNLNARSLVNMHSGMVGILYFSPKDEVDFSDPFLSDILTGIEKASKRNKKFILVHGFSDISDIQSIQQNWTFDGCIVIGAIQSIHDELCELIKAPIVFVDTYSSREQKGMKYPRYYVYNNDAELSYLATSYVIGKGHKKIAVFSPSLGKDTIGVIHERFTGYKKALEESQLSVPQTLFFDENELENMVSRFDEYTAVLANSDLLAGNLMTAWKKNGIQGKSIISFDNSFFASFLDPQLTTVELNQKEKGEKSIEVLMSAIQCKDPKKFKEKFFIQGTIIERNSVRSVGE
ncbi:MAG: LacI family transcriptional regulator [Lactobacillales bacterium]|jgi:LacI family transcriptional regulator|nr:LacI family transcriptional regulator [Lactobacillales bacterium]